MAPSAVVVPQLRTRKHTMNACVSESVSSGVLCVHDAADRSSVLGSTTGATSESRAACVVSNSGASPGEPLENKKNRRMSENKTVTTGEESAEGQSEKQGLRQTNKTNESSMKGATRATGAMSGSRAARVVSNSGSSPGEPLENKKNRRMSENTTVTTGEESAEGQSEEQGLRQTNKTSESSMEEATRARGEMSGSRAARVVSNSGASPGEPWENNKNRHMSENKTVTTGEESAEGQSEEQGLRQTNKTSESSMEEATRARGEMSGSRAARVVSNSGASPGEPWENNKNRHMSENKTVTTGEESAEGQSEKQGLRQTNKTNESSMKGATRATGAMSGSRAARVVSNSGSSPGEPLENKKNRRMSENTTVTTGEESAEGQSEEQGLRQTNKTSELSMEEATRARGEMSGSRAARVVSNSGASPGEPWENNKNRHMSENKTVTTGEESAGRQSEEQGLRQTNKTSESSMEGATRARGEMSGSRAARVVSNSGASPGEPWENNKNRHMSENKTVTTGEESAEGQSEKQGLRQTNKTNESSMKGATRATGAMSGSRAARVVSNSGSSPGEPLENKKNRRMSENTTVTTGEESAEGQSEEQGLRQTNKTSESSMEEATRARGEMSGSRAARVVSNSGASPGEPWENNKNRHMSENKTVTTGEESAGRQSEEQGLRQTNKTSESSMEGATRARGEMSGSRAARVVSNAGASPGEQLENNKNRRMSQNTTVTTAAESGEGQSGKRGLRQTNKTSESSMEEATRATGAMSGSRAARVVSNSGASPGEPLENKKNRRMSENTTVTTGEESGEGQSEKQGLRQTNKTSESSMEEATRARGEMSGSRAARVVSNSGASPGEPWENKKNRHMSENKTVTTGEESAEGQSEEQGLRQTNKTSESSMEGATRARGEMSGSRAARVVSNAGASPGEPLENKKNRRMSENTTVTTAAESGEGQSGKRGLRQTNKTSESSMEEATRATGAMSGSRAARVVSNSGASPGEPLENKKNRRMSENTTVTTGEESGEGQSEKQGLRQTNKTSESSMEEATRARGEMSGSRAARVVSNSGASPGEPWENNKNRHMSENKTVTTGEESAGGQSEEQGLRQTNKTSESSMEGATRARGEMSGSRAARVVSNAGASPGEPLENKKNRRMSENTTVTTAAESGEGQSGKRGLRQTNKTSESSMEEATPARGEVSGSRAARVVSNSGASPGEPLERKKNRHMSENKTVMTGEESGEGQSEEQGLRQTNKTSESSMEGATRARGEMSGSRAARVLSNAGASPGEPLENKKNRRMSENTTVTTGEESGEGQSEEQGLRQTNKTSESSMEGATRATGAMSGSRAARVVSNSGASPGEPLENKKNRRMSQNTTGTIAAESGEGQSGKRGLRQTNKTSESSMEGATRARCEMSGSRAARVLSNAGASPGELLGSNKNRRMLENRRGMTGEESAGGQSEEQGLRQTNKTSESSMEGATRATGAMSGSRAARVVSNSGASPGEPLENKKNRRMSQNTTGTIAAESAGGQSEEQGLRQTNKTSESSMEEATRARGEMSGSRAARVLSNAGASPGELLGSNKNRRMLENRRGMTGEESAGGQSEEQGLRRTSKTSESSMKEQRGFFQLPSAYSCEQRGASKTYDCLKEALEETGACGSNITGKPHHTALIEISDSKGYLSASGSDASTCDTLSKRGWCKYEHVPGAAAQTRPCNQKDDPVHPGPSWSQSTRTDVAYRARALSRCTDMEDVAGSRTKHANSTVCTRTADSHRGLRIHTRAKSFATNHSHCRLAHSALPNERACTRNNLHPALGHERGEVAESCARKNSLLGTGLTVTWSTAHIPQPQGNCAVQPGDDKMELLKSVAVRVPVLHPALQYLSSRLTGEIDNAELRSLTQIQQCVLIYVAQVAVKESAKAKARLTHKMESVYDFKHIAKAKLEKTETTILHQVPLTLPLDVCSGTFHWLLDGGYWRRCALQRRAAVQRRLRDKILFNGLYNHPSVQPEHLPRHGILSVPYPLYRHSHAHNFCDAFLVLKHHVRVRVSVSLAGNNSPQRERVGTLGNMWHVLEMLAPNEFNAVVAVTNDTGFPEVTVQAKPLLEFHIHGGVRMGKDVEAVAVHKGIYESRDVLRDFIQRLSVRYLLPVFTTDEVEDLIKKPDVWETAVRERMHALARGAACMGNTSDFI